MPSSAELNNIPIIAKTIAKPNAFRNPHTSNHSSILLANMIMSTFIMKLISHNVNQFIGKVSKRSKFHNVALSIMSTSPTTIAIHSQLMTTPGKK